MTVKNRVLRYFAIPLLLALLVLGSVRAYAADQKPVLVKAAAGRNKVKLTWEKVSGADRYVVYFHNSDGKALKKKVKTLSAKKKSHTQKGLKASERYKFMIVAQKKSGKKYSTIAKSRVIHAALTGSKNTNPKSVTASPASVLAHVGDTVTVKAKVKKADAKKKLLGKNHGKKVEWFSGDSTVATVDSNGKITAVKAGTCEVYAVAINGVTAKIPVTVLAATAGGTTEKESKDSYTVAYKYLGTVPSGAPAAPAEKSYAPDAAVAKQAVPKLKGYTFTGWKGEVASMPEKDITVTGFWTKNEHKVIFTYTNPLTKKEKKTTVKYGYGDKVSAIADPAVKGYKFDGLKGLPQTMPDKDVTVTGSFTKMCTVTAVFLTDMYTAQLMKYDFEIDIDHLPEEGVLPGVAAVVIEKQEFEVESGTCGPEDVLKKFQKVDPSLWSGESEEYPPLMLDYWYKVDNTRWPSMPNWTIDQYVNDYQNRAWDILNKHEQYHEEANCWGYDYASAAAELAEQGFPAFPEPKTIEEEQAMTSAEFDDYWDVWCAEWNGALRKAAIANITSSDSGNGPITSDVTLIGWVERTERPE